MGTSRSRTRPNALTRLDADREPSLLRHAGLTARARLLQTFTADTRSIATFRGLLGAVLMFHLCGWLADAPAFLGDAGLVPRGALDGPDSLWRITLHAASGQAGLIQLLLVVQIGAAAALLIGWRTRLAAGVSFVLYASLLNRAPALVSGGEMLLAALLFWSGFLPAVGWGLDTARSDEETPQPRTWRCWATAALTLQVVSACVAVTSLADATDPLAQLLGQPATLTPLGAWCAQHGLFVTGIHRAAGIIGIIAPLVLLTPVLPGLIRASAGIALAGMQVMAIVLFDLGIGPWAVLAALPLFMTTEVWNRLLARRAGQAPLRVYHDAGHPETRRWQKLWCILLGVPRFELLAAQDTPRTATLFEAHRSWITIDPDDRAHLRSAAWIALLRASYVFAPLGKALAACHAKVAIDRVVCSLPARWRCPPPPRFSRPPRVSRRAQHLCMAVLACVLGWNLAALSPHLQAVRSVLAPPLRVLRLDQNWQDYLPHGSPLRGWVAATGETAEGRSVGVLHATLPMRVPSPARFARYRGDIRWQRWDDTLLHSDTNALRYAHYLCRRWNARHPAALRSLTLAFIAVNGAMLEQHVLWDGTCANASTQTSATPADLQRPLP